MVDSGCYIAGERGGKEWRWGGVEVRRGGDEKLLPQPCNKRDSDAKKRCTLQKRGTDGAVWNVCSRVAETELCVFWTSQ